ncbi:hypothetical protein T4C_8031 [Trichinella pseudospiralis]|uniref:Uncharacterized protein n=1 Tax=Trichinella pseudospiralis TaxID=6337 RepID=A0A0V1KA25_TRIPS|nr:hypothetical protein T4C_8031 [Trichinella pseudospiralis]
MHKEPIGKTRFSVSRRRTLDLFNNISLTSSKEECSLQELQYQKYVFFNNMLDSLLFMITVLQNSRITYRKQAI